MEFVPPSIVQIGTLSNEGRFAVRTVSSKVFIILGLTSVVLMKRSASWRIDHFSPHPGAKISGVLMKDKDNDATLYADVASKGKNDP